MSATKPTTPTNPSVFGQMFAFADVEVRRSPSNFSMPASTIQEMEMHGIDKDLIETLFGPRDNIAHLYETNARLDPDKTDRAMRILRIVNLAEKVFQDRFKAMAWLKYPNKPLNSKPIDLLTREAGAKLVEEALLRISHGVYA